MNEQMRERIANIADLHWDWLSRLLELLNISQRDLEQFEYIYKTAFIHGAKHALEEVGCEDQGRRSYVISSIDTLDESFNLENPEGGETNGNSGTTQGEK